MEVNRTAKRHELLDAHTERRPTSKLAARSMAGRAYFNSREKRILVRTVVSWAAHIHNPDVERYVSGHCSTTVAEKQRFSVYTAKGLTGRMLYEGTRRERTPNVGKDHTRLQI